MAKPEAANSGCFSRLIRRMLCTGNVPTHPSDNITDCKVTLDMNKPKKDEKKPEIRAQSGGPGIVARLMGLDSRPEDTQWAPKATTPDSFSRSRSVNFVDYLLKFDSITAPSHQLHRRARTSVSFREVPASFQPQKSASDFLVIYVDNVGDSSSEMRKSELGFKRKEKGRSREIRREYDQSVILKNQKDKERTNNKILKLKNEPRKRIVQQKSCKQNGSEVLGVLPYKKKDHNNCGAKLKVLKRENQKKAPEKFTRKRKNQQASKKIQPIESSTENLSPVSALDEIYNLCSERHSRLTNSELKMEVESNISYGDELNLITAVKKLDLGKVESSEMAEYYAELAEQLRKLAEEDLSETHWISTRTKNVLHFEGLEDICTEFEWHILDVLLDEVTGEIMENI